MIKIDWLSFTVQKSMTPKGVIEYFGMDIEEFKEEARGLNGYRKQYTYRVNGNNGPPKPVVGLTPRSFRKPFSKSV